MAQVWELDLPQNEKFVLLAFADFADDDGRCYPSIRRIAWKTGYDARQIKRLLSNLRSKGLLRVHRNALPNFPVVYLVVTAAGDKLTPLQPRGGDILSLPGLELGQNVTPGVTDLTGRGDTHVTPGVAAMSPNPSSNHQEPSGKSKSRASALPPDFDLTDSRREYAFSKGIATPEEEMEAFKAHHTAHGKTMKNWDAAWRTWCINAKRFGARHGTEKPRRLSAVDRVRIATAAHVAKDGQEADRGTLAPDDGDVRPQVGKPVR